MLTTVYVDTTLMMTFNGHIPVKTATKYLRQQDLSHQKRLDSVPIATLGP
jgi:hypothetical protein